jgi:hypothetical protein
MIPIFNGIPPFLPVPGAIKTWSSISRKSSMAMDTKSVQVSTIVARDNVLAAGGK